MKKLSFVFVLLMLVINWSAESAYAGNSLKSAPKKTQRDIPFKAVHDGSGGNIARSVSQQPANASIDAGLLYIDFITVSDDITIVLTNKDTGKTVYSNSYSTLQDLRIDLNDEENGTYLLELHIDGTTWVGEFLLY